MIGSELMPRDYDCSYDAVPATSNPAVSEMPPDRSRRRGRAERQFGALVYLRAVRRPLHGTYAETGKLERPELIHTSRMIGGLRP
jgi:hypothetical protein